MTAEVLYFVNGQDTHEGGGDFRKVHLEKGELILDEETNMVHSPLHIPEFFTPVGSLRKLKMLITLMRDPERRFPGRQFSKEWGDVFRTESDVSKTVWSLRLTLADIGMINHLSTSKHRRRKMHSLIHSGSEGFSLTPYTDENPEQEEDSEEEPENKLDAGIYIPKVPHLRKEGIYFSSARYDFTSPHLRRS